MLQNQHTNGIKCPKKLSISCRLIALGVFLAILLAFAFLWICSRGYLEAGMVLGVCGFKQHFQLPCVGCGITTSSQAFVSGHILQSFYIQPAGGVLCTISAGVGVYSLLIAAFGVDFGWLRKFSFSKSWKYLLIGAIVVFMGGWAVTLARTIASRS